MDVPAMKRNHSLWLLILENGQSIPRFELERCKCLLKSTQHSISYWSGRPEDKVETKHPEKCLGVGLKRRRFSSAFQYLGNVTVSFTDLQEMAKLQGSELYCIGRSGNSLHIFALNHLQRRLSWNVFGGRVNRPLVSSLWRTWILRVLTIDCPLASSTKLIASSPIKVSSS